MEAIDALGETGSNEEDNSAVGDESDDRREMERAVAASLQQPQTTNAPQQQTRVNTNVIMTPQTAAASPNVAHSAPGMIVPSNTLVAPAIDRGAETEVEDGPGPSSTRDYNRDHRLTRIGVPPMQGMLMDPDDEVLIEEEDGEDDVVMVDGTGTGSGSNSVHSHTGAGAVVHEVTNGEERKS